MTRVLALLLEIGGALAICGGVLLWSLPAAIVLAGLFGVLAAQVLEYLP